SFIGHGFACAERRKDRQASDTLAVFRRELIEQRLPLDRLEQLRPIVHRCLAHAFSGSAFCRRAEPRARLMVRVWLAPGSAHRVAAHPPPTPARALQPRPTSTGSRGTAPLPLAIPKPSPRPSDRRARPPRDTPGPQSDRPRPSRRRVDSRPRSTRARARSAPTPPPFPPFSLDRIERKASKRRGKNTGATVSRRCAFR